jgi:threonine dehydratase
VTTPTPLEPAPAGLAPGRDVYLKREDVHELGAFKWRGALPTLEAFQQEGAGTVVTASTGNQGAATAWAAQRLGLGAVVFAPLATSKAKLAVLESLGADTRLTGSDFDEAKDEAVRFADEHGFAFFGDGAEAAQYEAYRAIGEEILAQVPQSLAAVVTPVGNGALAVGVGRAIGRRALRVGVVAKGAPVMKRSWDAGRPVETDRCATIADGLSVRVAIPMAVEALDEVVDRMLEVSEREIARAVAAFDDSGVRVEGAAAAALAALPQLADVGEPIVLIVTGRNIDDELLERCRRNADSFPE